MSLDLNAIWFFLVAALFTGYLILDGFDLGVGALHLFTKKEEDRRVFINAIGPFWDGNQVWLVTAGGATFAAFPRVYAAVFSGFYLALILLLMALIARAVSIEVRGKLPDAGWRKFWDHAFACASIAAIFLLGVAFANLVRGIPLDAGGEFAGNFLGLLNPYALLMGTAALAFAALHGALYLQLKTQGALQAKLNGWACTSWRIFAIAYILMLAVTFLSAPRMAEALSKHPALAAALVLSLLAVANIRRELHLGRNGRAFFSCAAAIAAFAAFFAAGMFPNLVLSSPLPENSLSAYHAASSHKTLGIMLAIAAIGMPLVLGYTAFAYWIFRGKDGAVEY